MSNLIEEYDLPEEHVSAFVYRGGSMLGTFRAGDRLIIEPVIIGLVRTGDVIAFLGPDSMGKMVLWAHRVIKISPDGLMTRGDNNLDCDGQLLTAGKLRGRVTHVERKGGMRRVYGGWFGLLRARILWSRIHLRNLVVCLGRGPYRLLRKSHLVPYIWRPKVTRMVLETETGEQVRYISKGRTVARWWPESGRFECIRPYDLVITPPDSRSNQVEP